MTSVATDKAAAALGKLQAANDGRSEIEPLTDTWPELDEHIEVLRVPLSQVMKLIAEGKIHDGKTLIGLSLYDAARREGRL